MIDRRLAKLERAFVNVRMVREAQQNSPIQRIEELTREFELKAANEEDPIELFKKGRLPPLEEAFLRAAIREAYGITLDQYLGLSAEERDELEERIGRETT